MASILSTKRVSACSHILVAGLALILAQACAEQPMSWVDFAGDRGDDKGGQMEVETQLFVSDDGHVSASGTVRRVSTNRLAIDGATFKLTPRTSLTDVSNRPKRFSQLEVGAFVEVNGIVADDGSFTAVSAREDATEVVCHVPRGNPENAKSLRVGSRAVAAHLRHGDSEGECEDGGQEEGSEGDEDDEEGDETESDDPDEEKALVCHIPPGNPDNAHTINIGVSDLQDHLDHGDYEGACVE